MAGEGGRTMENAVRPGSPLPGSYLYHVPVRTESVRLSGNTTTKIFPFSAHDLLRRTCIPGRGIAVYRLRSSPLRSYPTPITLVVFQEKTTRPTIVCVTVLFISDRSCLLNFIGTKVTLVST